MTTRFLWPILTASTLGLAACGGGNPASEDTSDTAWGNTVTSTSLGSLEQDLSDHTLMTLDYGAFKLWYDCTDHTARRYDYVLKADTGSATRPTSFTLDPALPAGCSQQTGTASYESVQSGWDRGHLVSSNHMDIDAATIKKANYMTNIAPQAAMFNRGIWADAEDVAECYRDLAPVRVIGGVIYGTDAAGRANDYFVTSHGIRTPEWFWKLILTNAPGSTSTTTFTQAIAWLIPNQASLGTLDSYLVSVAQLEQQVGSLRLNLSSTVRNSRNTTTWALPSGCSLSRSAENAVD